MDNAQPNWYSGPARSRRLYRRKTVYILYFLLWFHPRNDSASGLDPDITVQNATLQAARIHNVTGISIAYRLFWWHTCSSSLSLRQSCRVPAPASQDHISSVFWTVTTTAFTTGSVNASLSAFNPLVILAALFGMIIQATPGGIGVGAPRGI